MFISIKFGLKMLLNYLSYHNITKMDPNFDYEEYEQLSE